MTSAAAIYQAVTFHAVRDGKILLKYPGAVSRYPITLMRRRQYTIVRGVVTTVTKLLLAIMTLHTCDFMIAGRMLETDGHEHNLRRRSAGEEGVQRLFGDYSLV